MRRILTLIICILACCACEKLNLESYRQIYLTKTEVSFSAQSDVEIISCKSNVQFHIDGLIEAGSPYINWEQGMAEVRGEWLSAAIREGDKLKVVVSVAENKTGKTRTGKIYLNTGYQSTHIEVTQEAF